MRGFRPWSAVARCCDPRALAVQLDALDAPDLARILTEPPDALVKEYTKLLGLQGIPLDFGPEAVMAVAGFACERKVGARGLRAVMEEVMHDLMFEALEMEGQSGQATPTMVVEKLKNFDSGMLD